MNVQRKKIIKKLLAVYEKPNTILQKRSKLTYPTILRFMKGDSIRIYNEDILIGICLDLIEERNAVRKALTARSKKLLQEVENPSNTP